MNKNKAIIKGFDELTNGELYEVLRLRSAVFVVEQNCVYQDPDGLDRDARHVLIMREDGSCAAYARWFFMKAEPHTAQIGRVVSSERGAGLGRTVLLAAIKDARYCGAAFARVEAQEYAIGFYEKAGFAVTSDVFLEDGIPHVEMRLRL